MGVVAVRVFGYVARSVLTLGMGLATISVPSVAQVAGECACRVPASQATGQIKSADGEVLLTQAEGLINAQAGSALVIGDEIKTGPLSSTAISFGNSCNIVVTENADVRIQSFGNTACLWVEYQQKSAIVTSQQSQTDTSGDDDDDTPNVALILGGLAGVGGLLALVLSSGDSPASP